MVNRSTTARVRPVGITIIAILLALAAIWGIISGLFLFGSAPFAIFNSGVGGIFHNGLDGIFVIVIAIIELILAAGLFNLARWAFWATVIIEAINVLYYLFGAIGSISLGFGLGTGIIAIIILIYMLADGNVRRAFRV